MILFELAARDLRIHWLRSMFAVMGIVIGVAALATMGILGSSLALSRPDNLTSVGNTIVISPHIADTPGGVGGSNLEITGHQLDEIRTAAGPNDVVPIRTGVDRLQIGGQGMTVALYAMNPGDIPVLLAKESGSYLRYGTGVMVGAKLASETDLQVGDSLGIGPGEERVRIVGILKERGVGVDISPDYAVIVPDTWFSARYGKLNYDQVIIRVANPEEIDGVKKSVDGLLNRREQAVDILDTRKVTRSLIDTFDELSTWVTAIGSIALALAGISLLNVMLLSVSERAKEIGILRTVGAKRGEVMRLILSEALILGLLGSAIGAVISFAGAYLALDVFLQSSKYLFDAATLTSLLLGVASGLGVALLSGIYPAWKAATMNPADALRSR